MTIPHSSMNKIEQFWDWFNAHKYYYNDLESEFDPEFETLSDKLSEIDETITFEIQVDTKENEDKQIIISAYGNFEKFGIVKKVVQAAPKMSGWKVVAFQQPQDGFVMHYKKYRLNAAEMYFFPLLDEEGFNIVLYGKRLKKLNSDDSFYLGRVILMNMIGEFHFATKITCYHIDDIKEADPESIYPLLQLQKFVENAFVNSN